MLGSLWSIRPGAHIQVRNLNYTLAGLDEQGQPLGTDVEFRYTDRSLRVPLMVGRRLLDSDDEPGVNLYVLGGPTALFNLNADLNNDRLDGGDHRNTMVHRRWRRLGTRLSYYRDAAAFPQCVVPENEAKLHVSVGGILVEDPPPTKSQGRFGSPARGERELVSPLLIHRSKLAPHIAHHPEALGTLEAILHPRVRALEEAAIHAARRNRLRAVVLDVPLLFETDADQLCDVVVVAHATLQHRRRRAFARAGMTEEKWQRPLARQ